MKTFCFDLRALQIGHENRGIGMYIKSILENMPKDNNRYLFYAFDKSDPIKELGINFHNDYELIQTTTVKTAIGSPNDIIHLLRLVYHQFSPLRSHTFDVFVQFDFMLGLPKWRRIKKVVVAYDLIPLIKKNEYIPTIKFAWQHTVGKKAKLRAMLRAAYYHLRYNFHYKVFKKADQLISISQATAQSFTGLLGISQNKISVVPLAPVLSNHVIDQSIAKKIGKPYLFYIGGTDSRKNIKDIIAAFNVARGRGANLDLVLAGNEFAKLEHLPNIEGRNAILASPYKEDIHLVGFVSDEQKMGLYKTAYAFIFCSTFEGFGLPIIEAMSMSCPVIAYNNSSIPEAAGSAALLVETGDYVAMARCIVSLEDAVLRKKLTSAGLTQAKKFSWEHSANQFLNILLNC